VLAQRIVDLLEDQPRRRQRLGQRLAHADRLRALSRKDECACHAGLVPLPCPVPSARRPQLRREPGRGTIPGTVYLSRQLAPPDRLGIVRRLSVPEGYFGPALPAACEARIGVAPDAPPAAELSWRSGRMPFYESVFITRQDVSPQQVETLSGELAEIVRSNGGSIGKTEYWGLRNLTYRIKKNRKGHFVLMNLEAPFAAVAEMERNMRINEDVIRYLTVKVEALEEGPSAMMQSRGQRDGRREGGRDRDRDRGDRGDRGGYRDRDRGERGDRDRERERESRD